MDESPIAAPAVIMVADAFPDAGLGHLSRSTAIAAALRCKGLGVECFACGAGLPLVRDGITWSPISPSAAAIGPAKVLVVDSYRLGNEELSAIAGETTIVLLHDAAEPPCEAALVVSVAADASKSGSHRLSGPEYAALRPAFWGLPPRSLDDKIDHILVTTGSSTFGKLAADLARTASETVDVRVTLVLGPQATVEAPDGVVPLVAPDSLLEPLLDADLVVTSGGQTMLEAAAAGTPCIVMSLVENQRRQVDRLAAVGAVRVADANDGNLAAVISQLASDADARRELSRSAQRAVDGYGAHRIAYEIARLVSAVS
jgi:spore coat polysaccharide biosynthesis predicted glycosyltransferase SpsG